MTSHPEEADFFSSVWNPAFVQRRAAPVGCVYRLRRPNRERVVCVCVGSRHQRLWPCLRFREQRGLLGESRLCGPPAGGQQAPREGGAARWGGQSSLDVTLSDQRVAERRSSSCHTD